jgi:hypothetical protein
VLMIWMSDACAEDTRCDAVVDVELLGVVLTSEVDSVGRMLEDILPDATRSERLDDLGVVVELCAVVVVLEYSGAPM